MRVLVTGGSGFLGTHLLEALNDRQIQTIAPFRKATARKYEHITLFEVSSLFDLLETPDFFRNIDVVVHLAGLAHNNYSSAEFSKINTELPVKLASAAANAGVSRFVFISSIGVNGLVSVKPFTAFDFPKPMEEYAKSKYSAEEGIKDVCLSTGMEFVVIRPPLIYGKDAPGNFNRLVSLAGSNLPLPLGSINNSRSFVYVENLVDLLIVCLDHSRATNETFLVSDEAVVSTTEFLEKMIRVMGKKTSLLSVPLPILRFLFKLIGKESILDRFSSSLTIDIEHTKHTLNWRPLFSIDEGLSRCFDK